MEFWYNRWRSLLVKKKLPAKSAHLHSQMMSFVAHYAKVLGLDKTWDIEVRIVPTKELGDDELGNCKTVWPYKSAVIKFSDCLLKRKSIERELVAAHEVCHIFLIEHFWGVAIQIIGNSGNNYSTLSEHIEGLVEAIAHVIVGKEPVWS